MSPTSHNAMILAHLQAGNRITPLSALSRYGCFRLGARIWDLKQAGHPIEREFITTSTGKRVAQYRMGAKA